MVITGVGGTGVVTVGAVLAQAAQLDGKGAGMMEMAGLAQKGGAVHIHCRLAERPEDISAIRVATGECDALIGGDLVVSAGAKTLGLTRAGRTLGVVNSHEIITGEFTQDTEFTIPTERLELSLTSRLQNDVQLFDATELARVVMGDSIYSNMIVFGAAWQKGAIPVRLEPIQEAIRMNGTAVEANLRAFEIGRWAAAHPEEAEKAMAPTVVDLPKSLEDKIAYREAHHLLAYQGKRLARRYRRFVDEIADPVLKEAVAEGYHKLLSYKDEYEVARLLLQSRDKAKQEFAGDFRMTFHLAPPILGGKGPDGLPKKRQFGPWLERPLRLLARLKGLRGTPLDIFGYTEERRRERTQIREYEIDIAEVLSQYDTDAREAGLALARLPLSIRGFGHVKAASQDKAVQRRQELLSVIRAGGERMDSAAQ